MKKTSGFSLAELLVGMSIFLVILSGGYVVLKVGQSSWTVTDTSIQLQENARLALMRVGKELQESGHNSVDVLQVAIQDGVGMNSSDIVRFSIPICACEDPIINSNGEIALWGAPLRWGSNGCSDVFTEEDICSTADNKFIDYLMNQNNQLIRRVLDEDTIEVREDIIAINVTDFQAAINADETVITITISLSRDTSDKRTLTLSRAQDISLRNAR